MTRLVKEVDKFVEDHKPDRMAGYVVLLAKNDEENRKKLADFAEAKSISLPLTIAVDGPKGPAAYKLNSDVPITVLVSKRNKVEANLVLPAPEPKDPETQKAEVAQVIAAAEKLIAK